MTGLTGIPFYANSSFRRGAALAPQRIRFVDKEGSANSFSERTKLAGIFFIPTTRICDLRIDYEILRPAKQQKTLLY